MIRKNFFLFITLLSVLALALAGCGSAPDQGKDADGNGAGEVRITIGTGGNSGTYYPLGTALAQKIFSKVDGVSQARGVTTGASVANIQEMAQGKYQMAFVQNDIAYFAVEGETLGDFEGKPVENIAGMATLYPEDIQVVTRKDSKLESLEDLKGKKVAVGDQGSGAEVNAKQVLEAAGITYDDIEVNYLGFGDAAQGLQNGTLDAAFITAGAPTSAIQELGATQEVRILSIPDEVIQALTSEYSYFTEQTISADTYADQGQEEDIKTVSVMAMLIVDQELSEDLVYNLTKAMFEEKEALDAAHARGADITLESALEGMSIELHPGAKKYYDEQGISAE
ncbi:TAXI family TRAP transporter solute-binding subunit [Desmospora profundinema]|uniref:TRAP transporter TAXI family solute receptor n=1 Tax=Desmospora profundinema TaxID=1571184 RepID=A0ABU1IIF8_9BACL|nr:TAXI family TRAP transporter solute-binding subunit [Desmospora profundinema]MDR6224562.1 TRAP transporter TAXI family solute receptor [Desmospora profundinema]